MIQRIHIRNYLLIDALELELGSGLTIITGETGSGKSILVGALGLALGDRADAGVVRDPQRRCVIELELALPGDELKPWFAANELPWEQPAILRRQIDPAPGSRSRAFINDTPVRLDQLRELGARLVHVHSQHHTLLLNDAGFQLGLLDHWAGQRDVLHAYRSTHAAWRKAAATLERLREAEARGRHELDLLQFQVGELEEARLEAGEQERLECDLVRVENAGEIVEALGTTERLLAADDGVLAQLAQAT